MILFIGGKKLPLQRLLPQQFRMAMKLTVVFMAIAFHVSAGGFSQNVTLSLSNAPLEKAFAEIKKQTGISFIYTNDMIKDAKTVSINVTNEPLEKVLAICFKDQPFSYSIEGKYIVVKPKAKISYTSAEDAAAAPLPIDITGRVVNEQGQPVEGVTVTIKGTGESTRTNANGEFSLSSVAQDAVLVFTHVSMETFELKVSGRTELSITLKTKISALDEVSVLVNTGYQKVNKERFVGSASVLDSATFHRRAGMGIIERLDGNVTGVLFSKKGGPAPIQIRGINSFGAGLSFSSLLKPLIVVDNFPMDDRYDLNSINPNDVESIAILKDAAAASIWGTRAGNGVIVITTKNGRYNQRFQISASSNITITEKPELFYNQRISTSDFIDIEQYLFDNGFYDNDIDNTYTYPVISPVVEILARQKAGLISSIDAKRQIDALRNNDIRNDLDKYIYREAVYQQHYLNFSGGNNFIGYKFSAGYNTKASNIKDSKSDAQYTINAIANLRPIKNLEIYTGINFSHNEIKSIQIPQFPAYPHLQLADANGNALAVPFKYRQGYVDTVGGGKLLDWQYMPLDEIRFADNSNTIRNVSLNFGLTYKIRDWLNLNFNYQNLDQISSLRNYYDTQTFLTRDLINFFADLNDLNNPVYPVPKSGILDLSSSQAKGYNARGTITINKNWSVNQLTAIIGAEVTENKGSIFTDRLYGFNNNTGSYRTDINYAVWYPTYYASFPGATNTIPAGTGYGELANNRFVSFFANGSYTFLDRYTLYASARRDGSNVFGVNTNNKWKPLWSTGVSWNISKEKFYSIRWLPDLRLKGTFGYSGNVNNTGSGKFTMTYASFIGPTQITGLPFATTNEPPNPDLKWEQVKMINLGLEFALVRNHFFGSIEYFHKNASDIISAIPFDPTTGTTLFAVNYASLKGHGVEINLHARNTIGTVNWSSDLGISYTKVIVTKVDNGGFRAGDFVGGSIYPSVGRVVFGVSSFRWAGLDPTTGDPQGYLSGQVSKDYGAINNDSVEHQKFHGSGIPLYSAFLRNSVTWGNFTLSANITGRFDFYFRKPSLNLDYTGTMAGTSYTTDYYKRWQKTGDEAYTNIPSMMYPVPAGMGGRSYFYQNSEINVVRGDNIRLQDISLSYRWENKKWQSVPVRSVQLFIYPNNLNIILWRADHTYLDPDYSGGTSDPTAAPIPRTWTIGINVNFQ